MQGGPAPTELKLEERTMDFITQVTNQLQKMTESEKDAWILSQAKLTAEEHQADFLHSLTGGKKVLGMPSAQEIADFCQKVEAGDIYLEYMTRYCEFNGEGRYIDDWETWYEDPLGAGEFVDKVFDGCHSLLLLDECRMAADILEKILNLKFSVETAEESEDDAQEDVLSLIDADGENVFATELADAAGDWLRAWARLLKGIADQEKSRKLLDILEHPACKKVRPRILLEEDISQGVFSCMGDMLKKEIDDLRTEMERLASKGKTEAGRTSYENFEKRYCLQDAVETRQKILSDIEVKCMRTPARPENLQPAAASKLEESWKEIQKLAKWLSYETYIDDQPEQDEIRSICEALLASNQLEAEQWEIRRSVIEDIVSNGYFHRYGCDDCMEELTEKLCTSKEEHLARAGILEHAHYGNYREKAAYLYHQYGRDDKYVSYLEENLGRKSKEYTALIAYYRENGQKEEACRVARLGLERCKEDLTDCFICLLLQAREDRDEERFKKLYASAKRRKMWDIQRVNAAIEPSH